MDGYFSTFVDWIAFLFSGCWPAISAHSPLLGSECTKVRETCFFSMLGTEWCPILRCVSFQLYAFVSNTSGKISLVYQPTCNLQTNHCSSLFKIDNTIYIHMTYNIIFFGTACPVFGTLGLMVCCSPAKGNFNFGGEKC